MRKLSIFIISVFLAAAAISAESSYERSLKLFQEGKYEESLQILADILVVDDDFVEGSPNYRIRFLAAHNHWKLENPRSVIAHFRRCMDIDKTTPDPYIDLALYFVEEKRYSDARSVASEGLKIKEHYMLYWVLGRESMERRDFNRAKEMLEKANALNPEFHVSYNDLGLTLMELGRTGEANTAFAVALASRPDSAEVNNNMALCHEKMGNLKKALEYAERASALEPDNRGITANLERIRNNQ